MGEKRNAYSVLVGKPEGIGLLGRPRHRWEDNIRFILGEKLGRFWGLYISLRIGKIGEPL
jgi:hypothetical protein